MRVSLFHPRQELHIDTLISQAKALSLPLLGVPLQPGRTYEEQVEEALRVVLAAAQKAQQQQGGAGGQAVRLCFGDLHLEHVRRWREDALGKARRGHGLSPHLPFRASCSLSV